MQPDVGGCGVVDLTRLKRPVGSKEILAKRTSGAKVLGWERAGCLQGLDEVSMIGSPKKGKEWQGGGWAIGPQGHTKVFGPLLRVLAAQYLSYEELEKEAEQGLGIRPPK